MTIYNNNRFTPGNKGNMRLFMNKAYLKQYYIPFLINQTFQNITNANDISEDSLCSCIPQQSNSIKQGWNDPSQTENIRIAQIITGTLGGRTTFGNPDGPAKLDYLGGWEGQPGGSFKPLRNKF